MPTFWWLGSWDVEGRSNLHTYTASLHKCTASLIAQGHNMSLHKWSDLFAQMHSSLHSAQWICLHKRTANLFREVPRKPVCTSAVSLLARVHSKFLCPCAQWFCLQLPSKPVCTVQRICLYRCTASLFALVHSLHMCTVSLFSTSARWSCLHKYTASLFAHMYSESVCTSAQQIYLQKSLGSLFAQVQWVYLHMYTASLLAHVHSDSVYRSAQWACLHMCSESI